MLILIKKRSGIMEKSRENLFLFALLGILIVGMIIFNPNAEKTGDYLYKKTVPCYIDSEGVTNCPTGGGCTNTCSTAGTRQCYLNGNSYRICGNYDADSCLEWSGVTSCGTNSICSNGFCQPSCTNQCGPSGTRQCSGATGYQTCGNYDADSCLEWSGVSPCSSGQFCQGNGICASQNSPPSITSVTDSPDPVTIGSSITFTTTWSDLNGDSTTTKICKTNIAGPGGCSGDSWCLSSLDSTSPTSCSYTALLADAGTRTYYAFVCDNIICSPPKSGTFLVK